MATMTVLGSSSAGNGYILDADGEILFIELGCRWEDYLKTLNFDISRVRGAILTHEHIDHLNKRTTTKAITFGIPVYSCQSAAQKIDGIRLLPYKQKTMIGGFSIQPIPLTHNCECIGFLIEHAAFGRLLFASDTNTFPYRIKDLNHIFLESNYIEELLIDRLCAGKEVRSHPENHLSLEQMLDVINRNKSLSLQNVCAIHLSDGNSDEKKIISAIKESVPTANVVCADKGMIIELNKEEF